MIFSPRFQILKKIFSIDCGIFMTCGVSAVQDKTGFRKLPCITQKMSSTAAKIPQCQVVNVKGSGDAGKEI